MANQLLVLESGRQSVIGIGKRAPISYWYWKAGTNQLLVLESGRQSIIDQYKLQ
jgi:hypothetical protein